MKSFLSQCIGNLLDIAKYFYSEYQSIARRGALLHYKSCFTGPSNHKAQNHYLYPLNDYSIITVHYISRSFF